MWHRQATQQPQTHQALGNAAHGKRTRRAALWLALAAFGRAMESITVDRRPSAAFRTGGFFVACGLVLGRAVAGDWISADATLIDFLAVAWPLLILLGLAVALERLLAGPDKPETGIVLAGIIPGLAWIFLASVYLAWVGLW